MLLCMCVVWVKLVVLFCKNTREKEEKGTKQTCQRNKRNIVSIPLFVVTTVVAGVVCYIYGFWILNTYNTNIPKKTIDKFMFQSIYCLKFVFSSITPYLHLIIHKYQTPYQSHASVSITIHTVFEIFGYSDALCTTNSSSNLLMLIIHDDDLFCDLHDFF